MTRFVHPRYLASAGPDGLVRSAERLLSHLGFRDVVNVDGPGDQGGDIVARRAGELWVFQAKWKSRPTSTVGADALAEVLSARDSYGAQRAAIITNARASRALLQQRAAFSAAHLEVPIWDGALLPKLADGAHDRITRIVLHPYQEQALRFVLDDLESRSRALLVMATGLGKTFVAGQVVDRHIAENPQAQVLVVAHTKDLVAQLERALWSHLSKETPTQLVTGESPADELSGVTFSTLQTALAASRRGYRASLVVVDEAHHVGESGLYSELLELQASALQLGVTATPWRGDGFDISNAFGTASAQVSIEDGMRLGYLAAVNYRMFGDNLDWDFVRAASKHAYSIRDLNARLFLPGRDEAIADELTVSWHATVRPRGIVFCRTVEHAERMAEILRTRPHWAASRAIHAQMSKRERQMTLLNFRSGKIPLLVAVDVLNEGVDVPDVNILCFARVTHSRRIFIQQLGRGLRIRPGKAAVEVLDFVSDIRRVAALLALKEATASGDVETLHNPRRTQIEFADQDLGSLMQEWIRDAADLETRADESRLQFPDPGRFVHPS